MFYVIQEGEPIFHRRYRDAKVAWRQMVKADPDKQCGLFLSGSESPNHWWFGRGYVPWKGSEMSLEERLATAL